MTPEKSGKIAKFSTAFKEGAELAVWENQWSKVTSQFWLFNGTVDHGVMSDSQRLEWG